MLQGRGDAVIVLASDLQDPPEMIPDFLRRWEEGFKVVMGVKTQSQESAAMFAVRKLYYGLSGRLSDIQLVTNYMLMFNIPVSLVDFRNDALF